jgi:hypothetical protein
MLRFKGPGVACGLVPDTAAGHKDEDTYDRHAGNLYRQALFTLDDTEMAEQVVSDVIVEECMRPVGAVSGQDAGRRLAISAYQRCMGLAGGAASASGLPMGRKGDVAGCAGPGGLSVRERGVLGLVFFGALGYRLADVDLGISAPDVAVLLRAALGKAAASEPGSLGYVTQERAWP